MSASKTADECNECTPIDTVADLLNIHKNPMKWWSSVEPLQSRSIAYYLEEDFQDVTFYLKHRVDEKRAQLLICHDYRGNYLSDKYLLDAEKFDDYRFYNWSGCDIFCYFSHRFITIPTLQWLNAAHKHGVKVMGTLIVEWDDGKKMINDEILVDLETAKRVADALVFISKECQFEGWLINVESPVEEANVPVLKEFLAYLTEQTKQHVPNGKIIYYDSVIRSGELKWQNELSDENREFFENCDGLFLNYNWRDEHLTRTKEMIQKEYPTRQHDVFVGIDVFGRGQVAKWQSNETLATIRSYDFSVAIFAPGWTWESLDEVELYNEQGTDDCNKRFLENNDRFWRLLWPHLPTHAIDELPFYTSFCMGSGKIRNRLGQKEPCQPWFNLAKQDYQVSIPIDQVRVTRCFEDSFDGGSCLKLMAGSHIPHRLLVCNFEFSNGLLMACAIKRTSTCIDIDLVVHAVEMTTDRSINITCVSFPTEINKDTIQIQALNSESVQELSKEGKKCRLFGLEPCNGWEIRHFYLPFDKSAGEDIRLTDIGVRTFKTNAESDDCILLGAISVDPVPQ